jgi:hypothetical protein
LVVAGVKGKLGEEPSIVQFVEGFIDQRNRKTFLTMMALRPLWGQKCHEPSSFFANRIGEEKVEELHSIKP